MTSAKQLMNTSDINITGDECLWH